MKKIFTLIVLLLSIVSIKAYENDVFKIDIDESYKLEIEKDNAYRWTNNNKYIAISINSNKELKYDVKTFSQEDIDNQKKYFEEGINNGLSKYKITAEITNIEKKNNDEIYYLEYDIYYPSKKATGYDMYQKGRMYTTNKYIVTIIYSSDNKLDNDETCEKTLNSLKIFDLYEVFKTDSRWFIYSFITLGVISGVIGAIISTKKKRK